MKCVLIIILLFIFRVVGQEGPKAVLVDEFGGIYCDDYLARVDNFLISLNEYPNSIGYVVIAGPSSLRRRLALELWFHGAATNRKFDSQRIKFVRGPESESVEGRFWLVPAGAEKPTFQQTEWNFVFPTKTKPYVFYTEMEQICWSPNFASPYKEYLDANPGSRGHVVIYAESRRFYKKALKEVKEKLKAIPVERLRYFFVKGQDSPYPEDSAYADYWLVPAKR